MTSSVFVLTYDNRSLDDDEEVVTLITLPHNDVTGLVGDGLQCVGDGQAFPMIKIFYEKIKVLLFTDLQISYLYFWNRSKTKLKTFLNFISIWENVLPLYNGWTFKKFKSWIQTIKLTQNWNPRQELFIHLPLSMKYIKYSLIIRVSLNISLLQGCHTQPPCGSQN